MRAGHVFVAMPPLYRIDQGKEGVTTRWTKVSARASWNDIEAEKKQTGKINVIRFKGLGEMSPTQLRETTMAPDTRRLLQLTVGGEG